MIDAPSLRTTAVRIGAASMLAVIIGVAVGEPSARATTGPDGATWALVGVDSSDDPSFVVVDDSGDVVDSHPMVGEAGDKVAVGRLGDTAAVFRDVVPGWVGVVEFGEGGGVEDLGEWIMSPRLLPDSADVLGFTGPDEFQHLVGPDRAAVVLDPDEHGVAIDVMATGTVVAIAREFATPPASEAGATATATVELIDLAAAGSTGEGDSVGGVLDGVLVSLGPDGVTTRSGGELVWWGIDGERIGSSDLPDGELTGLADGSVAIVDGVSVARLAFGESEPVPIADVTADAVSVAVVSLGGQRWAALQQVGAASSADGHLEILAVVGSQVTASVRAADSRLQGPVEHDDRCLVVGEFEQTLIDVDSGDVTTIADGGTVLARSDDGCTVAVRGTSDHLVRDLTEVDIDGLILAVSADGRLALTRSEDGSDTTVVDVVTGDTVDIDVDADVGQFVFVAG